MLRFGAKGLQVFHSLPGAPFRQAAGVFQPQEGHVGHFFIFNVAAGRFAQLLRRGCTIQYIVNDLKTQA